MNAEMVPEQGGRCERSPRSRPNIQADTANRFTAGAESARTARPAPIQPRPRVWPMRPGDGLCDHAPIVFPHRMETP